MKQTFFIIFFLVFQTKIYCQKQGNNWYFGNGAGVNFANGNPTALTNGMIKFYPSESHNEGSSSISDCEGTLLFYSDGVKIYNRNHSLMKNGDSLKGNYSSTQSSIIVPDPNNSNRYFYIFTIGSGFCCNGTIEDGLRYSIIDINGDNNLGEVTSKKNIKLLDTTAEKLAVVRHSNGVDYWILTHKYFSNKFIAIRLTSTGLKDTIISAIGSIHSSSMGMAGVQGQLKFSPNGTKVAICASNGLDLLEIFDFDKSTGLLSNNKLLTVPSDKSSIYGVEFSPDNSKLYASGMTSVGQITPFMVQYDLNSGGGSLTSINNSMYYLYNGISSGSIAGKGLQLASNGKIYWVSLTDETKLAVVNSPNSQGSNCNFQDKAIDLGGKMGSYSLPTFIAGYDYSNISPKCQTSNITNSFNSSDFHIYPVPIKSEKNLIIESKQIQSNCTIYNQVGVKIRDKEIIRYGLNYIDLTKLTKGIYYIEVNSDNVSKIQKIVIE